MRRRRHPRDITTLEGIRAAMTNQTGSRRYGTPEALARTGRIGDGDIGPPSPIKSAFANYRIVDPIRKTALECAVNAYPHPADTDDIDLIILIARRFEQYLTGEEANG